MKYFSALFFLALLGLDIFSKGWALENLPLIHWYEGYPFNGLGVFDLGPVTFSLNFVTNTGAAWGLFAGGALWLFIVRLGVIFGLMAFLFFFNKGKAPAFPLWLILTGAVGNAIDYFLYGHVIDFFHFTFWKQSFPVFNFADSYITLGAIGLFLLTRSKKANVTVK